MPGYTAISGAVRRPNQIRSLVNEKKQSSTTKSILEEEVGYSSDTEVEDVTTTSRKTRSRTDVLPEEDRHLLEDILSDSDIELPLEDEWERAPPTTRGRARAREHPRRSRPKSPKLDDFKGEKKEWYGFIQHFMQKAKDVGWGEATRLKKLRGCLKGNAIEYYKRQPTDQRNTYQKLLVLLHRRYGLTTTPSIIRRGLASLKQDEMDIDEFADVVQKNVFEAFPKREKFRSEQCEKIAVDHFLNGIKNGTAKLIVSPQNPATLAEAVKLVKEAIEDQRGVAKVHWGRIQQVNANSRSPSPNFNQGSKSRISPANEQASANSRGQVPSLPTESRIEKEMQSLREMLEQTTKSLATLVLQNKARSRSPSPNLCYGCGKPGHFAKDCPAKRDKSRSPSPRPQTKQENK